MFYLPHTTSWAKAEDKLHESFDGSTHIVLYEVYEALPSYGLYVREEQPRREGAGWWIIGTPSEVEAWLNDHGIDQRNYENKAELGWKEDD